MLTSCKVVQTARGWRGVAFAHQGRTRAGIDCLGLLIVVAEDLDLLFEEARASARDDRTYGHQPDTNKLFEGLMRHLVRIPHNQMQAGDIVLLRIDGSPQHLAILSDYPHPESWGIIHAYAPARKVVEHRLSSDWQRNIAAVFRLPQLMT